MANEPEQRWREIVKKVSLDQSQRLRAVDLERQHKRFPHQAGTDLTDPVNLLRVMPILAAQVNQDFIEVLAAESGQDGFPARARGILALQAFDEAIKPLDGHFIFKNQNFSALQNRSHKKLPSKRRQSQDSGLARAASRLVTFSLSPTRFAKY